MALRSSILLTLLVGPLVAQARTDEQIAKMQPVAAEAIRLFVDAYEKDRLNPSGPLHGGSGLWPGYAKIALRAGLLSERDPGALRHEDALRKLLVFAERYPTEEIGDAVLGLAASGFDRSLIDLDAVMMRDLGHWSLMKMDDQGIWFLLMRTAAGHRATMFDDVEQVDPTRRVAALKLLGMKGLPVFRGTIEGALADLDPRVRLAAVEALGGQRQRRALPVLVRAMGVERHPVVSQAIVRSVFAIMRKHAKDLGPEEREQTMRVALRLLGRNGWRTDMELVDLVERYPVRAAIPAMISVLERSSGKQDELVALVNKNASGRLRSRAHECLRGLTGAIAPGDSAEDWRAFWEREQYRIRVPDQLPKARKGGTASQFFGIPVTGSEVAFVIDTSGSMSENVGGTITGNRPDDRLPTRLSRAKEQLLLAVQSMDRASSYHVVTFSGKARMWSRKAVPPNERSTRSLATLLSRFGANGGTNVYEALVETLALDEVRYGEDGKKTIDELFLLSDGEPTEGEVTDPEELLRLVSEANKYLRVRINTVFSGRGKGADFLRKLAEQNDGKFVQR